MTFIRSVGFMPSPRPRFGDNRDWGDQKPAKSNLWEIPPDIRDQISKLPPTMIEEILRRDRYGDRPYQQPVLELPLYEPPPRYRKDEEAETPQIRAPRWRPGDDL